MGMVGMTMDPSLQGRRTGAKSGFDCTRPFGRDGEIPLTRSAAKVFKGPARVPDHRAGSRVGADVLCRHRRGDRQRRRPRNRLRIWMNCVRSGRLGRDRDGRYHLVSVEARRDRHRRRALSRSQHGDLSHAEHREQSFSRTPSEAALRCASAGPHRDLGRKPRRRPTKSSRARSAVRHRSGASMSPCTRDFRRREHRRRAQLRS